MDERSPPVSVVDDRYDVRERIGSGGFSTVWRAVDQNGGPDLAVKFPDISGDSTNNPDEVRNRFRQEYDIYSDFRGSILPKSIARFVTGRRSDPAYIGMEYLKGEELTTYLSRSAISPGMEVTRTYGFPIVRALEFLHQNGYCYLDCKPANVVVRESDDSPVLIDFNTAVRRDDAGSTLFYEDAYKAPEQTPGKYESEVVGPWSDVYALGKLLCYLLCGVSFDTSETPPDGIDPCEYGADCSSLVASSIKRATAADPAERPANAYELLSALYRAENIDRQRAMLGDQKTSLACPVWSGDSVGRISEDGPIPEITVADSRHYISPVHFTCTYDDTWVVTDASLNGTYVNLGGERVYLLSDEGYERLREQEHERVASGKPYTAARIHEQVTISPVDPEYPVTLTFTPKAE